MAVFINITKRWTLLIGYVLMVTIVFLYVLFPTETVKGYIGYRLSEMAPPDITFDIGTLGLGLPPSLSLDGIDVEYMDQSALKIEQIDFLPAYFSLLTSKTVVRLNGVLAGGNFQGKTYMVSDSGSRKMEGDIAFADIRLEDLPILQAQLPAAVSGRAEGNVIFNTAGKATSTMTVTDCGIKLEQGFMGIDKLSLTRIDTEAEMENRRINVKRIDMAGPQFSGTGSGTILIAQPMESSRLNFSVTIKPHPSIMQSVGALIPKRYLKEGGIPVRITGTADSPKVTMR